jgi:anti-sigma factor RsiW
MKSLPIIWQRLVSRGGKTCDRCNATYQEMQQAVSNLKQALRPLGIEPTLETREIEKNRSRATPPSPIAFGSRANPWRNGLGQESEAVAAVLFVANPSVGR